MNACSERKPRSFAAERTRSRNSLLGKSKFRSFLCFTTVVPRFLTGGTFVAQSARKSPPAMRLPQKGLAPTEHETAPPSFMFQYPPLNPLPLANFHSSCPVLFSIPPERPHLHPPIPTSPPVPPPPHPLPPTSTPTC